MSPAIGKEHHTLKEFAQEHDPKWRDHIGYNKDEHVLLDIQSFNKQAFIGAGVPEESIEVCGVNTFDHPEYFSYRGGELGRFAVFVMLGGINTRDDTTLTA
jgi:copper oxidase (laccase) domain-containing protein